jgi:ribosomal protein S18 acetylase RimI-like enzyme
VVPLGTERPISISKDIELLPRDIDSLVAFIEANPLPTAPRGEARRLLTTLLRGDEAILAWPRREAVEIVAVVADVITNIADAAELLALGASTRDLAGIEWIRERGIDVARGGIRSALDIPVRAGGLWDAARLEHRGFKHAYSILEMRRALDPAEGSTFAARAAAPPGLTWHRLPPERAREYARLVVVAMAGIEGTNFPPEDEITAATARNAAQFRMLAEGDRFVGYVRVVAHRAHGDVEAEIRGIGLHPDARRRGLGDLLVAKALEMSVDAGAHAATLEVAFSNPGAQRLYLRAGFQPSLEERVYRLPLRR